MDRLPQEILGEILLKLPAASLMQACCVSKKLDAFIHGSFFSNLHFKHTRDLRAHRRILVLKENQKRSWNSVDYNPSKRLKIYPFKLFDIDDGSKRPVDVPLPFPADFDVRLYGSCNGIVCITHCSSIYLCNPTTRKFLTLPEPSITSHYAATHGIGLGFDSARDNYYVIRLVWFLGGYDLGKSSILDDIEVSNLLCHNPSAEDLQTSGEGSSSSSSRGILGQGWPTLGAEVYDLNINSWRKLDVVLPHIEERNTAAVLAGRYFHWCTKHRTILAFDLSHRSFRQIDVPGYVPHVTPAWNVGVLDDSLAVVFLSDFSVEVWVMEGYGNREGPGESWVKRGSVITFMVHIGMHSLTCWNDGRIFMVSDVEPELISCPLEVDESTEGYVISYGDIRRTCMYSLLYLVYQESFISLDRGHEGMPWRSMDVRRY